MAYYQDYNSPDTKLVSVRIRMDLFERIDKLADESGRSRSAVVNALLAKSLGADPNDRVAALEDTVAQLSSELAALRREVRHIASEVESIDIDAI